MMHQGRKMETMARGARTADTQLDGNGRVRLITARVAGVDGLWPQFLSMTSALDRVVRFGYDDETRPDRPTQQRRADFNSRGKAVGYDCSTCRNADALHRPERRCL
jgi:hypothetical protein